MIKQALRTVFSCAVFIDGFSYNTFCDIQLKQNADGMGISGVSSAEFDFSISYDEYAKKPPKSGAEVIFSIGEERTTLYTFYISQRSRKGGKVSFKCYDRLSLLEISTDLMEIPYENIEEDDENSGDITLFSIASYIAGYVGLGLDESIASNVGYFGGLKLKKTEILGKTARALFDTISAAWCGFFTMKANNIVDFVFFGQSANNSFTVKNHAAITMQSERSAISKVIAYSGSEYFYATDDENDDKTDVLSTLKIQTDFASEQYAEQLLYRVKGFTYISWRCSKAIVDVSKLTDSQLPIITANIAGLNYPDDVDPFAEFIVNSMILKFTSTGIYAEMSSNEVTEDEQSYIGFFSRKLADKITNGEKLGNDTMITRYQGIVHLGEKKEDEKTGEVKQTRYSYSKATSSGIVEFSGAMVSKVVPSSAIWNADKSEAVVSYDGKRYKYTIEKDDEGNVLSFKKSEVKE
ncbi:MAG: hypothetical protein ACI4JK_02020 [Oscillospiraceae bacterium]